MRILGLPRTFARVATTLVVVLSVAAGSAVASESTGLKGKEGESVSGLVAVGTDAIDFTLDDLDGAKVAMADLKGNKAVLLTFWSFFCGPCREEIPVLDKEIVKKYADKGLEMLAVNLDGPKLEKAVRRYMDSNGFTFRVVWEQIEGVSYKTADAYGVAGTPTLVLIGKNGKVSWAHVGREDLPIIVAEVKKALELD